MKWKQGWNRCPTCHTMHYFEICKICKQPFKKNSANHETCSKCKRKGKRKNPQ